MQKKNSEKIKPKKAERNKDISIEIILKIWKKTERQKERKRIQNNQGKKNRKKERWRHGRIYISIFHKKKCKIKWSKNINLRFVKPISGQIRSQIFFANIL